MSDHPSLTERAHRLLTVSVLAPALLFGAVTVAAGVDTLDAQAALIGAGTAVVLGVVGAWTAWSVRNKPDAWQAVPSSGLFGSFLFAMVAAGNAAPGQFGLSEDAYFVVSAAITAAMALLAWLPARRATRMVFPDLGPEVVDSSLVVTFTARGKDADRLAVTPAALELAVRPGSVLKATRHSFPLGEVTGVTVRAEAEQGEHPVPGADGPVLRTPPGDVLVVDVGDGQLVFAVKDPRRTADFIRARARRRAAVTES